MMALLAGSKLAVHTLQLTSGSKELLPRIFPGVDHIAYFNLATDEATRLLLDTAHHLGAVAIPYALAVHEDFVMNLLDLVQHLGFVQKAPGDNADVTKNRVSAWNMHEAVYLTLGVMPPPKGSNAPLEHFHLLREMRNCQIHEGGQVSNRLRQQVNDLSPAAELDWLRLSRRAPVNAISSQWLHFTVFDIFAVFATTKSMGRTLNAAIRDGLTKSQWSQICVDDYDEGSSRPRNSDTWMTGLLNHAAMNYGATGINSQDVIDAAVRAGKWPAGRIPIPRSGRASRNRGRGR